MEKCQKSFQNLRSQTDTAHLTAFEQLQRTLRLQIQAEIELGILLQKGNRPILAFSLSCKGGAQLYFQQRLSQYLREGHSVILLMPNAYGTQIQLFWREFTTSFLTPDLDFLQKKEFEGITKIVVNSLLPANSFFHEEVSDPDQIKKLTDSILNVKSRSGALLEFCVHDYYPLCPYLNMLSEDLQLCDDRSETECDQCIQKPRYAFYPHTPTFSIHQWRKEYLRLFQNCDRLLFFSEDTLARYKRFLPELEEIAEQIELRPHKPIHSFAPLPLSGDQGMVIGVIGSISDQKGAAQVIALANFLEERKLPAKLIVIGEMLTLLPKPPFLKITGRYPHEKLPEIVLENHINVGWFPSVAPETFSFVAQEMMQMGIPSACFNIGAPRDRFSKWEKGAIIPEMTPESAWETLRKLYISHYQSNKDLDCGSEPGTACLL